MSVTSFLRRMSVDSESPKSSARSSRESRESPRKSIPRRSRLVASIDSARRPQQRQVTIIKYNRPRYVTASKTASTSAACQISMSQPVGVIPWCQSQIHLYVEAS
ncbi:hypothetical protein OSTOST_09587 [Ostertagia ostertagi]